MKNVFVVYKTDNYHNYGNREVIGVASTQPIAINICKQQARKETFSIDKEQLFNLRNLKQTQGYEGEGEFHYEELAMDTLI